MTSVNAGGNGQAPTDPATPAANGQAPTTAQANNTSTPSAGQNGQAPAAITEAAEVARMTQELAEARREAAKYRIEHQKLADEKLTAEQKLQRDYEASKTELTAVQRELSELKLTRAIERKASALNIINPEVAARLLDWSEVKFDDNGAPKNLDALLTALIQAEPYLVANSQQSQQQTTRPASSGGATNPGAGGVGGLGNPPGTWSRTAIAKMSDAEYIRNRAAIQEAMNKGLLLP
jgi:hypothetical protein